ncbi:MAG TPA: GNAT family N-acetyltransferase [Vicinamibacterales bacterium]|jgi:ribosomal protein S18 acetylase RimI-like enzyme|nr:GNAT family N-acetyltransferase [Vicinamibacterales bacterium]
MKTVRQAAPADARALAQLRWEFRSPLGTVAESHDAFLDRCAAWIARELEAGEWRCWMAEDDGRAIGQVWLRLIQKLPNPTAESERHAYLSNLYVDPGARGGVGERLLVAALDAARRDGVDCVVLWPTERSRSLYARHGFRADGTVMELKLGDR